LGDVEMADKSTNGCINGVIPLDLPSAQGLFVELNGEPALQALLTKENEALIAAVGPQWSEDGDNKLLKKANAEKEKKGKKSGSKSGSKESNSNSESSSKVNSPAEDNNEDTFFGEPIRNKNVTSSPDGRANSSSADGSNNDSPTYTFAHSPGAPREYPNTNNNNHPSSPLPPHLNNPRTMRKVTDSFLKKFYKNAPDFRGWMLEEKRKRQQALHEQMMKRMNQYYQEENNDKEDKDDKDDSDSKDGKESRKGGSRKGSLKV
jgi:hypothetical protein